MPEKIQPENAKKYQKCKEKRTIPEVTFFCTFCALLGGRPVRASKVQKRVKNAKIKIMKSRSFSLFLDFPGPRLLGLHFLGAFVLQFVCILIKFCNL